MAGAQIDSSMLCQFPLPISLLK